MESRIVKIGDVRIGGGNKPVIQSMCSTDTEDVQATIRQINELTKEGCEIIRVTVPTVKAAKAISKIKKAIKIPLIADIHYSPDLAILALENGADKIRINPGNIGGRDKLTRIIISAKKHKAAIRIGVNEGSLESDLLKKYGSHSPKALVLSAKRWIKFFENESFRNLVVSVKSSDVRTTIEANRMLKNCGYPLHIGVTEAGTKESGTIKSAIGIGTLLAEGVGDTIRISLSTDPIEEVSVAKKILDALDIIKLPLRVIACPTCGRNKSDVWGLAEKLERDFEPKKPLTVAVLGCGVNVVGESKAADYAIVGVNGDKFTLFKKDKPIIRMASYNQILSYLKKQI